MIADLTGLPLSNSSLLDEATAAAEAMSMCYSLKGQKKKKFFVDVNCHPQNIALCKTRGENMGLTIEVGHWLHPCALFLCSFFVLFFVLFF